MTPGVSTALARWDGPLSMPMKSVARRMISADSAMPVWPHRLREFSSSFRPKRMLAQLLRPFHLPIEADWDWRDLSSGRIGETTAAALRFQDLRADPRCFLIDSLSASLASNLIETVELSAAAFLGRKKADR